MQANFERSFWGLFVRSCLEKGGGHEETETRTGSLSYYRNMFFITWKLPPPVRPDTTCIICSFFKKSVVPLALQASFPQSTCWAEATTWSFNANASMNGCKKAWRSVREPVLWLQKACDRSLQNPKTERQGLKKTSPAKVKLLTQGPKKKLS